MVDNDNLTKTLWHQLRQRLDDAAARNLKIRFWWRDDDAAKDSPALQQLLALSHRSQCPVALAVIPAALENSLATALCASQAQSRCLLHGYDHQSRSPAGVRKCELGPERDINRVCQQLLDGHKRLKQVLGQRYLPALVPPWNRLRADLPEKLAPLGITGLSVLGPVQQRVGLNCHNVHLDLINWKQRSFAGEAPLLARLIELIAQRLEDNKQATDATTLDRQAELSGQLEHREQIEPIGLMSHHLVTDQITWVFFEQLLHCLAEHPGARITHPDELFGQGAT